MTKNQATSACSDYFKWAEAFEKATQRRDALVKQAEKEERKQLSDERLAALKKALMKLIDVLPGVKPCPKDC